MQSLYLLLIIHFGVIYTKLAPLIRVSQPINGDKNQLWLKLFKKSIRQEIVNVNNMKLFNNIKRNKDVLTINDNR